MDNSCSRPLVELRGVSKGFDTKAFKLDILRQTDFKINKGDTIAIVGASGIGKSTILNILGTLDPPDSGELIFQGIDLGNYSDEALAIFRNLKIGFVFQFHYLLSGFSTLENVIMPGLIRKSPKKKIAQQAKNMLERVGLKDRIHYRVEDLSGGEQQRVALARALIMEPELLLADEPTGNLDPKNSNSIHRLIKELNKELDMTIVVVTHNHEFAQMMDKTVTIEDYKIIPLTQ